ncbi:MAG: hypothetical protein BWY15_01971 [Firmicutes bacterium ADurb.Bin193]|nr:MAG: hypothetical protein BWY15_01971 [Firmicutes bacterium ADurb.Bin193]
MDKQIKCISCRYARPDKASSDNSWTAYECGNPQSEFYKSLLNVRPDGNKLKRISWPGCEHGERRLNG